MLKHISIILIAMLLLAQQCLATPRNQVVTVVAVNKVTWTTGTSKTTKKGHGGRHAGAAAAGLWVLGPVGALAGYAISKGASEDDSEEAVVNKETRSGFDLKLSNGEHVRTLVKYKVGQKLKRGDIDEEL